MAKHVVLLRLHVIMGEISHHLRLEEDGYFLVAGGNPDGYVYTHTHVSNTDRWAGLGVKTCLLISLL